MNPQCPKGLACAVCAETRTYGAEGRAAQQCAALTRLELLSESADSEKKPRK
jgi:hypothetical protein